jgi:hypothetical protein
MPQRTRRLGDFINAWNLSGGGPKISGCRDIELAVSGIGAFENAPGPIRSIVINVMRCHSPSASNVESDDW